MTLDDLKTYAGDVEHSLGKNRLGRIDVKALIGAIRATEDRPLVATRLVPVHRPSDWERAVDFWTGTMLAAYANALDMAWTVSGEMMSGRWGR